MHSYKIPKKHNSHFIQNKLYRCNVCDTLFNTSMSLEYHKEEYGHWTSDEDDDDDDDVELGN